MDEKDKIIAALREEILLLKEAIESLTRRLGLDSKTIVFSYKVNRHLPIVK